MLDTVDIEGLKGVGKVELKFDPDHRVRVLFGVNGVGKTKTLEAMYLGLLFSQSSFAESQRHTMNSKAGWEPAKRVLIDGTLCLDVKPSKLGFPTLSDAFAEEVSHSGAVVMIGAGGRSSVAPDPVNVGRLGQFEDRQKAHFDRVTQEMMAGALRMSGMTADVREWFVQRAQSVNPYQIEKDNLQSEIDAVL
ncbi:MAG: hypothetical protein ABW207_02495, partial [Stenotrophomonas chelatiphaga]